MKFHPILRFAFWIFAFVILAFMIGAIIRYKNFNKETDEYPVPSIERQIRDSMKDANDPQFDMSVYIDGKG